MVIVDDNWISTDDAALKMASIHALDIQELPARSSFSNKKKPFKPKERTASQLELQNDVYQLGSQQQRRIRSMSTHQDRLGANIQLVTPPKRRLSHDERSQPLVYRVYVDSTIRWLEEFEDTDHNGQITIEDAGPKVLNLGSDKSNGYKQHDVRGTYALSNLYQELTFAKEMGLEVIKISDERLFESPLTRLRRLITERFWPNLLRTTDGSSIRIAARDPKAERFSDQRPRIYVPIGCPEQFEYYTELAAEHPDWQLDVCTLPKDITPEYVKSLNEKPGLLALAMKETVQNGKKTLVGEPFVVPGGRFNELYGWDSYFMALGLLESGFVHLAKSMVTNFCFEIEHYGKILNANRSYYLCRSQPPFLTDMALRVYQKIKKEPGALDFLRMAFSAAIKEYFTVWTAEPRLDRVSGLSRYRPDGLGIPPETEASHFESILQPFAEKHGITVDEFHKKYDDGDIKEPELDEYFMHDRAVRESGHDTTYRLDGVCADLATVDLNSLLFKYEKDIEHTIHTHFGDKFALPAELRAVVTPIDAQGKENRMNPESSVFWTRRKQTRQRLIRKYLWDSKRGAYFDYNTATKSTTQYWSATAFWPLWAGLCKPGEATGIILNVLPKLEEAGGLVSGNLESRGDVGIDRPNRQWDFPYGWAPHQILAWQGLTDYGYHDEARRLMVKWMALMLKSFVDYHGVVVEKYDVTNIVDPHRVDAEYGNQGADIRGAAKEGFGWVNASFQVAYNSLDLISKRFLDNLATVAQINDQFSEMMENFEDNSFVQDEAVSDVEAASD